MLRRLRALLLLSVMGLTQPGTAPALGCEPSSQHEHCASYQDDSSRSTVPHDPPSCSAMLTCAGALALPPPAYVPLESTVSGECPVLPSILLHSRIDPPANPPPRA